MPVQCIACAHLKSGTTDEGKKMAALGFGLCAAFTGWQHLPPGQKSNATTFSMVIERECDRHAPAPAKDVEARRAWLDKQTRKKP